MLILKPAESFREPFSVANSEAAVLRFPFPFGEDRFMYSVNVVPHGKGGPSAAYEAMFDLDEHYLGEMAERRLVLEGDASRCRVQEGMKEAEWDVLELLMTALARDYPDWFGLEREGDEWRWVNRALGVEQRFKFGDVGTLPRGAFEYVTRQVQGDFVLLGQRDGVLYMDGGMVTAAAGWSFKGNFGKSFHGFHEPVPLAGELGVFDRAQLFLLRLKEGMPMRRVAWGMTVYPRLDISAENAGVWELDKGRVTAANVGGMIWLRVELQTLTRLRRSQAILFGIRTYMLRLDEVALVGKWAKRLHRVMRTLHPEIVSYKGLEQVLPMIVDYLAPLDDGAALGAGAGAEQTSL